MPDEKEPHWNAFEKVHISLTPVEILTGQRVPSIGNEFISTPGRTACSVGCLRLKADTCSRRARQNP